MDYKKIFKSRNVRLHIMQALSFIPDKTMVQMQYRIKLHRKLNLQNPIRYTEKLQWYKIFYRDPVMKQCVDKYEVREYVKKLGFEYILNDCYGVFDSPEDIDFDVLPDSFVIKDTLGGGGNAVIIVQDKSKLDKEQAYAKMHQWVSMPVHLKHPGREWVYDGRKHRIVIEKFIESDRSQGGLIDYKFFCFHGEVAYVYGIADRDCGDRAGIGIFNSDFELLPVHREDEKPLTRKIEKPANYTEMINVARKLSARFPHARVDLYSLHDKVIFGEITFFDGSGYMSFNPDEFDCEMGNAFSLPERYVEGAM